MPRLSGLAAVAVMSLVGLALATVAACVGDDAAVAQVSDAGTPVDAASEGAPAEGAPADGARSPRCTAPKTRTTVALFDAIAGRFDLFADNAVGLPSPTLTVAGAAGMPIGGHWKTSANGADTVGWQSGQTYTLLATNNATAAATAFTWGDVNAKRPVAGDWDGDGASEVGLFLQESGVFFLKKTNGTGDAADEELAAPNFSLGAGGIDARPLAGDWNGDGTDGVGIFVPGSGLFYLKNDLTSGNADFTITTSHKGSSFWPIAGDWDGCGPVRPGLYDTTTGTFYLLRERETGAQEDTFAFASIAGKTGIFPIAGKWAR